MPQVTPTANDPVVQNFLKFARMTPAEKMRAKMLSQLGLTEDDLKAMSPKEREKVEKKIADMIKKQLGDVAGKDKESFASFL